MSLASNLLALKNSQLDIESSINEVGGNVSFGSGLDDYGEDIRVLREPAKNIPGGKSGWCQYAYDLNKNITVF